MEKPLGVIVSPRPISPDKAEFLSEIERRKADEAMIQELKSLDRDEIGEQFKGRYYKTFFLFWDITFRNKTLEVTRYYPDRGVAIDIFESIGSTEQEEIDFKRSALKKQGVKYAALSYASDLSEILSQIGTDL